MTGSLEAFRNAVVDGLCDVVADPKRWKEAIDEEVMEESLLRSVRRKTAEDQFRRLLAGGARLTRYHFSYIHPKRTGVGSPPISLSFDVRPESFPPTNVHVIIGRNGVGKTYTLQLMMKALVGGASVARQSGHFRTNNGDDDSVPFVNLVSVSFSAFDDFEPLPERKDRSDGLHYSYIGLRRASEEQKPAAPKSPQMLTKEFVSAAHACVTGARLSRWNDALRILEADPLFKEAEVAVALADVYDVLSGFDEDASALFRKLSSGHKVVLLTIARLVETVDEKTLVLLDEPEAHLHPPLLSAFVRALSNLLIHRNGVAIIATHSPVVLQEVPKECVWKVRRTGLTVHAERPEIETFGENVGVLTREVFGLEVAQSGFHKMLLDAAREHRSFDAALESFDGNLGAEAHAILRGLFAAKSRPEA